MVLSNKTELIIIDAARKVFISNGYYGTTMEKIATTAKVSKASLHYYYRSKDKLFEIILAESCDIIQNKLISIVRSEENLEVIINELINVYVETLLNHPYLANFIITEISNNPEKVLKLIFGDKLSTFTILRLVVIIRKKLFEENIKDVDPFDLILNIISINVFPFLIRPLIINLFEIDNKQFITIINNRKQNLSGFILKALKQ